MNEGIQSHTPNEPASEERLGQGGGRDLAPLVSIIIATYEERYSIQETIPAVFREIRAPVEIIVVDDDSRDGTADNVRALDDPRVKLIHRKRGKGLAQAITRGIMESKGDIVGWIDADMAREVAYLRRMVELTSEYDVVVASRLVEGGKDGRAATRTLASVLVNVLARVVLGSAIRDYSSCVAMVRREVFDDVIPIAYGFGDFFIEFIHVCYKRGFKVHEMPFALGQREAGISKSFPSFWGFLWLGFKYCVRIIAIRFRPD